MECIFVFKYINSVKFKILCSIHSHILIYTQKYTIEYISLGQVTIKKKKKRFASVCNYCYLNCLSKLQHKIKINQLLQIILKDCCKEKEIASFCNRNNDNYYCKYNRFYKTDFCLYYLLIQIILLIFRSTL